MGERSDGLDPAIGSTGMPAGSFGESDMFLVSDTPADKAGDIERTETDTDLDAESPDIIQAREEIEVTRAEMSETIDALKERLDPQRLKEEAKENVREATIGRAEKVVHNAKESALDMLQEAETTAKGAGNRMLDTIKENPVPAALIGIGAGWLLMNARQHEGQTYRQRGTYRRPEDYGTGAYDPYGAYRAGTYGTAGTYGESQAGMADQARERVGEVKEKAQETVSEVQDRAQETMSHVRESASQLGEKARYTAQKAGYGLQEQVHQNPLGMGLAAMALGIAVGFVLPETRQENQLMGEARENLMETVSEKAQGVAEKAQSVADRAISTATETVQQEVKNQGLSS